MKQVFLRHLRPGIRFQIVAGYTAIFCCVLLLAGALCYHYVEQALENNVTTSLQLQAQQIAEEITAGQDTLTIHDTTGRFAQILRSQPATLSPVSSQEALVRLFDTQGRLIRQTPASQLLPIPLQSVTQPLHGQPWQGSVHLPDGQEVQLYSQALVTAQGKPFAIVQVGQVLTSLHALLDRLIGLLLAVGALVLLVCAVSSSLFLGRAFAPIEHVIQTARRIKAGHLDQRIPLPRARDEIYALVETLNDMLDSLDQALIRQRRFVADASHELRTPVTVIRTKASMALLHPGSQQETNALMQDIAAETERLGHLISDLLALARGDEGRGVFEQEPVRLDQVAEATAQSLQALAEEKQIHLSVHSEQPVTILGDEARLIQVLVNLLQNALQYTPSGGQVSLTIRSGAEGATVLVRDTGIGIAPEHLPHIFERFYRADPARRQVEGHRSGLGLAIVAWIVRQHGGTIYVDSQVGQGSCFSVSFPHALLLPTSSKAE